MERTSWIVVGTNFGQRARHALAYAIEVAARSGARIALVHAYESAGIEADEGDVLRGRLDAEIARSQAAARGVTVEPVLRRGAAWDKLKNVATDLAADSIVVGTGDVATEGVTARVLSVASRSVLVVALHGRDEA